MATFRILGIPPRMAGLGFISFPRAWRVGVLYLINLTGGWSSTVISLRDQLSESQECAKRSTHKKNKHKSTRRVDREVVRTTSVRRSVKRFPKAALISSKVNSTGRGESLH